MKKFTKDDIAEILKRLLNQDNYNDIIDEINEIADELSIDLTEPDEEEEEVVIEEDLDWDAADHEVETGDDEDWEPNF